MPHLQAADTINRTINFLDDEERILERAAKQSGQSFAEFIRAGARVYIALRGDKASAVKMARLRRARSKPLTVKQRRTRAVICGLAFLPMVLSMDFSARPLRSARRQEVFVSLGQSGFC